ncbi:MAG: NAD+ synthase [Candidatus Micrarchaeota archaeon]|nr:NAD+ synthase [Candidatus Micrarchaeota archaeon]
MDEMIAASRIAEFIRGYFSSAGKKAAVLGVSGGVDSAVALALCVRALGKKRVLAVLMPSDATPENDMQDALLFAEKLGVECESISIQPILDAFGKIAKGRLAKGNLSARIRMAILYSIALRRNGLVVGTGDKSEFLLGYFTKYGDGAADLFPLAGLYKTEVARLGRFLGIPESILRKPPSPALWRGQTAESELGFSYQQADAILSGIERGESRGLLEKKFGKKIVAKVIGRMQESLHKRLPPPICLF